MCSHIVCGEDFVPYCRRYGAPEVIRRRASFAGLLGVAPGDLPVPGGVKGTGPRVAHRDAPPALRVPESYAGE